MPRLLPSDIPEFANWRKGKMQNPIIERVHAKIDQQQEKGLRKYGEYVNPDSYTLAGWLTHLQQELIDGIVYIELALKKLEEKQNVGEADNPW